MKKLLELSSCKLLYGFPGVPIMFMVVWHPIDTKIVAAVHAEL
jgi:hypothetical protein